MATKYYKQETITGVINSTVYGSGVPSIEGEKRRVEAIIVTASAKQSNVAEGWIDREKVLEVPTQQIPLRTYAVEKRIEVGHEIEIGHTFKAALLCGGTANDIDVTYEYTIVG